MYEVRIIKTEQKACKRREWRRVADPPSEKEYDYVDDDWFETVETIVLSQRVESLDIPAVIRAVNTL